MASRLVWFVLGMILGALLFGEVTARHLRQKDEDAKEREIRRLLEAAGALDGHAT